MDKKALIISHNKYVDKKALIISHNKYVDKKALIISHNKYADKKALISSLNKTATICYKLNLLFMSKLRIENARVYQGTTL